jgi:multicomponent K+:H+ antiporter subunit E
MKRLVPSPLLTVVLAGIWLLLNGSLGAGAWLGALLVGVTVPLLTASLRPDRARLARPAVALRLLGAVALDVMTACGQVARGVLRAQVREPRSAFVSIPLDTRDAHALATLAVITTIVPGTVWSELAPDRSWVLLHVFDVEDEAAFIEHYKHRYERPLTEIFR